MKSCFMVHDETWNQISFKSTTNLLKPISFWMVYFSIVKYPIPIESYVDPNGYLLEENIVKPLTKRGLASRSPLSDHHNMQTT